MSTTWARVHQGGFGGIVEPKSTFTKGRAALQISYLEDKESQCGAIGPLREIAPPNNGPNKVACVHRPTGRPRSTQHTTSRGAAAGPPAAQQSLIGTYWDNQKGMRGAAADSQKSDVGRGRCWGQSWGGGSLASTSSPTRCRQQSQGTLTDRPRRFTLGLSLLLKAKSRGRGPPQKILLKAQVYTRPMSYRTRTNSSWAQVHESCFGSDFAFVGAGNRPLQHSWDLLAPARLALVAGGASGATAVLRPLLAP